MVNKRNDAPDKRNDSLDKRNAYTMLYPPSIDNTLISPKGFGAVCDKQEVGNKLIPAYFWKLLVLATTDGVEIVKTPPAKGEYNSQVYLNPPKGFNTREEAYRGLEEWIEKYYNGKDKLLNKNVDFNIHESMILIEGVVRVE